MLSPDVRLYMTHEPYSIESTASLARARELMDRHMIRHLPVIDGGQLMGILTRRDIDTLARVPGLDLEHVECARVMADPNYVWSETPLHEVARAMVRDKRDCLVVRGGRGVEGIFTATDALVALSDMIRMQAQLISR